MPEFRFDLSTSLLLKRRLQWTWHLSLKPLQDNLREGRDHVTYQHSPAPGMGSTRKLTSVSSNSLLWEGTRKEHGNVSAVEVTDFVSCGHIKGNRFKP
jgi:hypothetical protein